MEISCGAKALRRWPTKSLGRCRKRVRKTLDWLELPRDVMVSILRRLEQAEILMSVQYVCSTWLHICRDPQLWRSINLCCPVSNRECTYLIKKLPEDDALRLLYENLCFQAVHYSAGHLTEITIECFATDRLLLYICERSSQLKCLLLRFCFKVSHEALLKAVAKLPLLEELELRRGAFSPKIFEVIARCCPNLKTLKYNCVALGFSIVKLTPSTQLRANTHAFCIAQNFPRLRHLELICNALDDDGLRAILDGCPLLESLDLLFCLCLDMRGDLRERCYQQFKYLRLPLDGALDEVNESYRPSAAGHILRHVVHTLQERKPLLLS